MSLENCPRCGKVYPRVEGSRELCPACIQKEDDDYKTVFQYLSNRPSASAQEIADGTGVDIKEIFRFLRENRLRIVKIESDIRCESCGTPIVFGKYCEKCQAQLKEDFKKDLEKMKVEKGHVKKQDDKYTIRRNTQTGHITRKKRP